jgi:hypothetical protein
MGRLSGPKVGPVRSMRLPTAIDEWFEARYRAHQHRSASELLVELIHGGLRLRDAYMSTHRYALETRITSPEAYNEYKLCLLDTFGLTYVKHLESWLEAEGVIVKQLA